MEGLTHHDYVGLAASVACVVLMSIGVMRRRRFLKSDLTVIAAAAKRSFSIFLERLREIGHPEMRARRIAEERFYYLLANIDMAQFNHAALCERGPSSPSEQRKHDDAVADSAKQLYTLSILCGEAFAKFDDHSLVYIADYLIKRFPELVGRASSEELGRFLWKERDRVRAFPRMMQGFRDRLLRECAGIRQESVDG